MLRNLIRVFALLGVVFSAPAIAAPYVYSVEISSAADLGNLGGDEAEARDINNQGAVVGWARTSNGSKRAFLHAGIMVAVGPTHSGVQSHALGINDWEQIVGEYWGSGGQIPFYYHSTVGLNQMSELLYNGQVPANSFSAKPFAINNHGLIAGQATAATNDLPWNGCYEDLPVYWEYAQAHPSDTYVLGNARTRAFLWHNDFGLYLLPLPPGFSPFTSDCVANSIANRNTLNSSVQMAGYCTKKGRKRAVKWMVVVAKTSVGIPSGS